MWSGVVSANTRGGSMFLRVYPPSEGQEILVNVNSIWKIEVQYAVKREGDGAFQDNGIANTLPEHEEPR
jgi:hypothetical protein